MYIHRRLSLFLKLSLLIGASLMFFQGRYQAMAEILIILFITFLPLILGKRFDVQIPHGFETLAVIFLYMSLFLGESQGYYTRFWWWDLVLHSGSAFLLGILGFLLVYILNEKKEIDLDLKPGFVAFFAFMFAVGMGTIWEIFEYFMDRVLGLNMQKSGLQDTMWDLIVDVIGAAIISFLGWGYIQTRETDSFLERWIEDFINNNPHFFQEKNDS
ncbi:MAG: hypothetical protein HOH14_02855 [Gammaproteobacteria bacterium]|nr:hypothetical protein [Gammaproteobacteria bacterium]